MLSSYLFRTDFKIDEKFNAKGIQNNGIWNHTTKGYWENKSFLNLPYNTNRNNIKENPLLYAWLSYILLFLNNIFLIHRALIVLLEELDLLMRFA